MNNNTNRFFTFTNYVLFETASERHRNDRLGFSSSAPDLTVG